MTYLTIILFAFAVTFLLTPSLVDVIPFLFGGAAAVSTDASEGLGHLASLFRWWFALDWDRAVGGVLLVFVSVFLFCYYLVGTSLQARRGDDGGPLGDAKVLEGRGELRRASDLWNGKEEPEGCGLAYGFDGKFFLFEKAIPHSITVGTSGGRKSRGPIMQTIDLCAAAGSNIVVSDVKGEIVELMGDGLAEQGYNVLILDVVEPRQGNTYDPLATVAAFARAGRSQDAQIEADTIAMSLVGDSREGKADHWIESARSILSACMLIVAFAKDCPEEQRTMASVARLFFRGTEGAGKDPASPLKDYIRTLPEDHPARGAASQFLSTESRELSSIISTLKVNIRPYTQEDIAWMTSGSDIDVERVLTEKTAVFMRAKEKSSPYNGIFSIFIDQLYQAAQRVSARHGGRLPRETNMILDEAGNLPVLSNLAPITKLGRSMGLRVHLAFQTLADLKKYPEADRRSIMGNCGVQVALQPRDEEDRRYFSDLIGKTTRHTESRGSSTNAQQTTTSTTFGETADHVIHTWEWDLRSAGQDGAVVHKAAYDGSPASHAGNFIVPIVDVTKTPAKGRYSFGTMEQEAQARTAYRARLAEMEASRREERAAAWCPRFGVTLSDETVADDIEADEWSGWDEENGR